jgi:hypothetical protein
MPDSQWMAYAGLTSGVIGAVTGIAGSVMGYLSYRKTRDMKALDLRIELRRQESDAQTFFAGGVEFLKRANNSRRAVASANGFLNSGRMVQWDNQFAIDLECLSRLVAEIPQHGQTHERVSVGQLESKLVAMHTLKSEIGVVLDKYKSSLAEDDESRREIRATANFRTNP